MSLFRTVTTQFDASNMSAFGTLEASELTPIFQSDFVHGLNSQIWNTGVTSGTGATVDTNVSRLRIRTGTGTNTHAYITSRKIIRYRPGQGVTARFTPLFTGVPGAGLQLWGLGSIASNAPRDGYFFGYTSSGVGVVHYNSGVQNWIPQSEWNGNKCDGSAGTPFEWIPENGTPVMIKYPFLGYGDIQFFVQCPATGRWVLVHVIEYANSSTMTQLSNPSVQFLGFGANTGDGTARTMYCGSVGVFISGPRLFTSNPRFAFDMVRTAANSETLFCNIKNASTYNGVSNRGVIRLNSISVAAAGNLNTTAVVRFKIGTAPSGSPSFVPINGSTSDGGATIAAGHSIASVDTAGGIVVAGVNYVFNFSFAAGSGAIDLTGQDLFLSPGEVLSISIQGSANTTTNMSLNWSEDV